MENDNVPTEIIINRLGDPKELAKAYLGNLLANSKGFSWNRILIICAFYSIVGFSGMIVIPCLAIIAPRIYDMWYRHSHFSSNQND